MQKKLLIGIRRNWCGGEGVESISPTANVAGTIILGKYIAAFLALDGIVAQCSLVGPLNQFKGVVSLNGEFETVLAAIMRGLESVAVVGGTEFAWWDEADNTWRKHPYGVAIDFNLEFGAPLEVLQQYVEKLTSDVWQIK